jgi:predicted dehydrogenase
MALGGLMVVATQTVCDPCHIRSLAESKSYNSQQTSGEEAMAKGNGELGWALIGCGGFGRTHARGASATAGVEVRGFCDIVPEKAQEYSDQFGGYTTGDLQRVLDDRDVDIVSIATPHNTHAELALAAFAAGKHVYLEKPMAMTTDECLRVAEAQRSAGKQLMINFSWRFSGAAREIKRRISNPVVSHAQVMSAPGDLSAWRWDPVAGGGPLWDDGIHAVDLLMWFHHAVPVEVYATGGNVSHPEELAHSSIIDTTAGTLRFGDGSVATLLVTDIDFNAYVSKWLFETYAHGLSAVMYNHCATVAFSQSTGSRAFETLSPPPADRLPFLVEAIKNGGDSYVPASAGIAATHVIERIIESARTGQPRVIEVPSTEA